MVDWEASERRWLELLLSPDRKPSQDPVWELSLGIAHMTGSLRGVGELPVDRMDVNPDAWDVILRSPTIFRQGGPQVLDPSGYWPLNQYMGITVIQDDQLPKGVIVFRDSAGRIVRMVMLVE